MVKKDKKIRTAAEWLEYENNARGEGFGAVCGADEAGRGPLAGPVCAAAVILPEGVIIEGADDSKKLSEKKREELFDRIIAGAAAYGIAYASVEEIERLNILNAAMLAMKRAVGMLKITPDLALIDGNKIPDGLGCEARCIIGGDGLSMSIACASILAKVTRDRYMRELAVKYPRYGFEKHKGYGTKAHIEALREYGVCPEHRPCFLRKIEGIKL